MVGRGLERTFGVILAGDFSRTGMDDSSQAVHSRARAEPVALVVVPPPWAPDGLYYSSDIAIPTFLSDADKGRETLLTPMCMEERGQTCRTRTRDGRCTRET